MRHMEDTLEGPLKDPSCGPRLLHSLATGAPTPSPKTLPRSLRLLNKHLCKHPRWSKNNIGKIILDHCLTQR